MRRWFDSVDVASLVFFRIAFGALMFVEVLRYFTYGWIERYYIAPSFHFTYLGFGWVQPWPGAGMYLHFAALGVLSLFILAGFWYRAAAALFCIGFTYVFLLDEARYLNHFYLICLLSLLLVFMPAHRSFAVDAWRRPEIRSDVAPAWTVWLLRTQIGILYFYGGVAKLNADWLAGNPLRAWLAARSDFPIIGPLFLYEPTVQLFTFGSLAFDLLVVPFLLWRRTRPVAFGVAVAFHALNWRLFNIGIFPPLMIAATCLFFDPDWPRKIWRRVRPAAAPGAQTQAGAAPWWSRDRVTIALVAFYVAVQVVVPLRHFLYPGDVNWTEEGHRFSWRMKLRDKIGHVDFAATNVATRATWAVAPHTYLMNWQLAEMTSRPDMILQLCHHVADNFRGRAGNAEVRAQASLSLNGRRPQLLIDPDVNLAGEARSLWPAKWIVPLGRSSPRAARDVRR